MNLLNRYIFSQFIRYFFTVNMAFVSIWLLIDFFEKGDDFSNAGKPLSMSLTYFALTIPSIMDQLGPVFILLAGVITLGILNHSNELTALKAGGLPLRKIIRPIIVGGLLITTIYLAAAQWLLPITVSKTNHIWYQELKGKVPLGIVRNGRYYYRGAEGFYSFAWPNPKRYIFNNFSYSTWDKEYNLNELITAKYAFWHADQHKWELHGGQIQHQQPDHSYKIDDFRLKQFTFNETPTDFLVPVNKAAEYSLTDLFWETERARTPDEKHIAWTSFLGRISFLLLGMPLLLLGLPILLYSYRKWGRDLSVAIPVSCGLAFLAWGLWGALQSLSIAGYIAPWLAASSLHILFILTGSYLLKKNDR